MSKSDYILN